MHLLSWRLGNCSGDCPWRSPSSVHHHRPNLGRCDAAARFAIIAPLTPNLGCHLHYPIAKRPLVPACRCCESCCAIAAPSIAQRPQGCTVVQNPTALLPSAFPVRLGGRSGVGITLCRSCIEPIWHKSHFPPGLPCLAAGSASETSTTLGGG